MNDTDRVRNSSSKRVDLNDTNSVDAAGQCARDDDGADVTLLLHQWRAGDSNALASAWPMLYAELARNARGLYAGENAGHTLEPAALVNEALIKLMGADITWQDRCHFLAVMTRSMRQVLIDHARAKRSEKRGGDGQRVTLATNLTGPGMATDMLDLDCALEALSAIDARKADIVTMVYFGGMRQDEIAMSLGISEATVTRDLRFARAWLRNQLEANAPATSSALPGRQ